MIFNDFAALHYPDVRMQHADVRMPHPDVLLGSLDTSKSLEFLRILERLSILSFLALPTLLRFEVGGSGVSP